VTSSAAEPLRFSFYDTGSLSVAAYDLIEDTVRNYGEDAAFYLDLCRGVKGAALDLGTGTGRVAWALADAGCEVVGLDLSQAMLDRAEAKRAGRPPEILARCRFVQGDMAAFELGRTFARILIPFRSFNHLTTPEQQIACLRAVRRHLAPGGVAVAHLFMLDRPDQIDSAETVDRPHLRVRAAGTDRMIHWQVLSRRVDLLEQVLEQEVSYTWRVVDGPVLRQDLESFRIGWIGRREMAHLAARCGLRVTAEYADFAGSPPRLDADHVVVLERDEAA